MTEKDKIKLKKISDNLRRSDYHNSTEPTNNEVIIAWLLTIINELQEEPIPIIKFIDEHKPWYQNNVLHRVDKPAKENIS